MKNVNLLLGIGGVIFVSFLFIIYFYLLNVDTMNAQAETIFVHVLKQELENRRESLNIPYSSFNKGLDTVPLTIHITTEKGKYEYKIDSEKSKINISQNRLERSLQSISLIEYPLSPDTLRASWQSALLDHRICATAIIQISIVDLEGRLSCIESGMNGEYISAQSTFVSYIGSRCEVEVVGYLKYAWWMVCWYYWSPFFWDIIVTLVICVFLFYFSELKNRSHKIEIVEKEVIREVVSLVKEVDKIKPELYRLNDELVFNPRKQLLIHKGNEIKLSPQSAVILKFFLDAPGYTVTDDELVKNIWGVNNGATIKNFRSASQRIYNVFDEVGFSIKFLRVGIDKYTMLLSDNQ